jgi:hypothetical protein
MESSQLALSFREGRVRATRLRPVSAPSFPLPQATPGPTQALSWDGIARCHLHSPRAERRSFTNQSPCPGTHTIPEAAQRFEGCMGPFFFLANPFPTQMTEFQSRGNGSSQKERHGRLSDGTGSHRKEKKPLTNPALSSIFPPSISRAARKSVCFSHNTVLTPTPRLTNCPTDQPPVP